MYDRIITKGAVLYSNQEKSLANQGNVATQQRYSRKQVKAIFPKIYRNNIRAHQPSTDQYESSAREILSDTVKRQNQTHQKQGYKNKEKQLILPRYRQELRQFNPFGNNGKQYKSHPP